MRGRSLDVNDIERRQISVSNLGIVISPVRTEWLCKFDFVTNGMVCIAGGSNN